MRVKAILPALAVCLLSGAGEGVDLHVTVWRGESKSIFVSDEFPETGREAPGVTVRRGTLLPVRYNKSPTSLEYRFVADRAVYDSTVAGLHFATVTADTDATPGEYRLGQLVVTVLDRLLPPPGEWNYYLDLWQHPWAVARVNGVKPFSPEHYAAMEPLWKMLADAGQKALTVTLVDQPWNHQCYDAYGSMIGRRKGADGRWSFDYSVFDQYVEFGKKCGLAPDIACYTMCPWGYVATWRERVTGNGEWIERREKLLPGTPEFEDYWGAFLVDFSKHLKEKGWFENTYIAMDERSPEDLACIAAFVCRVAPGLKVAMAGNRKPSEFKGIDIDSYSQAMEHVDKPFLGEVRMRRAAGKITTYYVCCNPARPNTFMASGPGEAFVCGFAPAAFGLDGFLRWAYNSWGEDANNDMTYSRWAAGDVALVYPDGSPSWRFLELRNGIVAAEKFRILREQGGHDAELDALAAKFDVGELIQGADYEGLKRAVDAVVDSAPYLRQL